MPPNNSMQFDHALTHIIHTILLANPCKGLVRLIKINLSFGFYQIWLCPEDSAKFGVLFPNLPGESPLVAILLVLPMGWKNSTPLFSATTETIADFTNARLL